MRVDEKILPQVIKFKRIRKQYRGGGRVSISVSSSPQSNLYVNANAFGMLEELGFKYVAVSIDPDIPAIRLEKVDNRLEGYKLTSVRAGGGRHTGTLSVKLYNDISPGQYRLNKDLSNEESLVFIAPRGNHA